MMDTADLIQQLDRSDLYALRDYINCNWEQNGLTIDEAQYVMDLITKEIQDKQMVELMKPMVKEFIKLQESKQ